MTDRGQGAGEAVKGPIGALSRKPLYVIRAFKIILSNFVQHFLANVTARLCVKLCGKYSEFYMNELLKANTAKTRKEFSCRLVLRYTMSNVTSES